MVNGTEVGGQIEKSDEKDKMRISIADTSDIINTPLQRASAG
jgi:hypothetical protein